MNDYIDFLQSLPHSTDLSKAQIWADLGCGSGVFTEVLTTYLAAGSEIIGVDERGQSLVFPVSEVKVSFVKANFETDFLDLPPLHGILMANALHYVKDKRRLIRRLGELFVAVPRFVIVEYENTRPNSWVPFPIDFAGLKELFTGLGYQRIERIASRKSVYGGEMYAAVVHY